MKYYILILITSLLFSFTISSDKVLICLSSSSYAYHKYECQGLSKCTHGIKEVTKQEALEKYGKNKACGYCY